MVKYATQADAWIERWVELQRNVRLGRRLEVTCGAMSHIHIADGWRTMGGKHVLQVLWNVSVWLGNTRTDSRFIANWSYNLTPKREQQQVLPKPHDNSPPLVKRSKNLPWRFIFVATFNFYRSFGIPSIRETVVLWWCASVPNFSLRALNFLPAILTAASSRSHVGENLRDVGKTLLDAFFDMRSLCFR